MLETFLEFGAEFGAAAVRAVGALCATSLGVVIEMNGLQTLNTSVGVTGAWMAALGCLLLIVGYVLATDAIDLVQATRQPAN